MNKLVSRNPILKFKLGNKIRKMGEASGGGLNLSFFDWFNLKKRWESLLGKKLYVKPTYGDTELDPNRVAKKRAYKKGLVTYHLDKDTGIWYAKWNRSDLPNQGYYRVAEGSTGYDRFGNHKVLRNGEWVKIKEPSLSIPVNNIWLKGYKHDEVKDVRAMLNELIKLGLLKDKFGADGKWGDNTEAAYLTYLTLKNIPTYTKDELNDNTLTTPTTSTILEKPVLQNDFASQKLAGYPSSLSRGEQLFNSITLRPEFKYGYSNYRNFTPFKFDLKPMYKQGGQLPSRNIVERFKQRNFR